MDCKECKESRIGNEPIPFIVYESSMARMERTIKRLWILLILLVTLLVATNCLWLWYESQFEEVITTETTEETYEANADNDGVAIVNRDGEVSYGGNG